jgi:hypothetical protein
VFDARPHLLPGVRSSPGAVMARSQPSAGVRQH